MPGAIEIEIMQCVLCLSPKLHQDQTILRCDNGHSYPIVDDVIVLLPPFDAHDPRREEEKEFADGSPEAERTKRAPWLWISRFPAVERFDKELLACFGSGRFLELGGGSCYASAIVKSTHPEAIVYASDVAVNTLRNKAKPVCSLFPRQPDFYVAIAGENLPFRDGTIDYIFGELFLHHSLDPARILREANRVLSRRGRMIFLEPAVPRHFAWLFRTQADSREEELSIHESLLPLPRWEQAVKQAGLPKSALRVNTSGDYQSNPWFALAGRLLSRLPKAMVKRFFPVGAVIDYQKP